MSGGKSGPKRLLVDSGAVDRLARHDEQSLVYLASLARDGYWPPVIPTVVLTECVSGTQHKDALANRFIKTCQVLEELPEETARRAGKLRSQTKRGSAVDAILVALAEPGGVVITEDTRDLEALASNASNVVVVSSSPRKR